MANLRLRFISFVLLMFADADAKAVTPTIAFGQQAADVLPTKPEAEPAWIKWVQPTCIAFIIIIIAAKVIFWPGESNTRPMTPEERTASQERMLDTVSNMRMLQAMGRGDGDAIRDEMKLIELRNIRRQNE